MSRKVRRNPSFSSSSEVWLAASWAPVRTISVAGSAARTREASFLGRDAGVRGDVDAVVFAGFARARTGPGGEQQRDARSAEGFAARELGDAGDRVAPAPERRQRSRAAHRCCRCSRLAVAWSIAISSAEFGKMPLDRGERLESAPVAPRLPAMAPCSISACRSSSATPLWSRRRRRPPPRPDTARTRASVASLIG